MVTINELKFKANVLRSDMIIKREVCLENGKQTTKEDILNAIKKHR